jgi:hypothetical protein
MSGVTSLVQGVRTETWGLEICGGQAIRRRRYGGSVELKRSGEIATSSYRHTLILLLHSIWFLRDYS